MRKTTFVNLLCGRATLFCLAAIIAVTPPSFAQTPTTPASPSDPKELMLQAAKVGNLTGEGIKPWHFKASYTLFDENGGVKDQGTFEESWAAPDRYKLTTTGQNFVQTDYGTRDGILRSGQEQDLPQMLTDALRELVAPLPPPETIHQSSYAIQNKDIGSTSLSCLTPDPHQVGAPLVYCLAGNPQAPRADIYNSTGLQALRNRILQFSDRTVAGDVVFKQAGKTLLSTHLENLEFIVIASDAIFTPPVGTLLLPRRLPGHVEMSAGMAQGLLVKKVAPVYPPIARAAHVSGTVILQAVIGEAGRVESMRVISGPAMLQQTALDAVKDWIYRPYLLNGEPIKVLTTVNVIFSLN